jgi:predicted transcriptional regulator
MATPWRKLWTQMADNAFLMTDQNALNVMIKLLLIANDKGEVTRSGRDLAEFMALPHSTLYKTLVRLEEHGIIKMTAQPRGRHTTIGLVNWHIYQPATTPVGKQLRKQQNKVLASTSGNSSGARRETAGKQRGNSDVANNRGNDAPLDKRIKNKSKTQLDTTNFAELQPELDGYIEMRKGSKFPLTQYALDRLVAKLRKMYPEQLEHQKAALDKATVNGWRDVYQLKPDEEPSATQSRSRKYQGNY